MQVDKGVCYCQGCGGDDCEESGFRHHASLKLCMGAKHKPQDSAEAGQLADDYAQARKVSGSG